MWVAPVKSLHVRETDGKPSYYYDYYYYNKKLIKYVTDIFDLKLIKKYFCNV